MTYEAISSIGTGILLALAVIGVLFEILRARSRGRK